MIFLQISLRKDAYQEELKQGESEPIAALCGAKFGEKQWRRGQKQQKDDGWNDLNHEFVFDHGSLVRSK